MFLKLILTAALAGSVVTADIIQDLFNDHNAARAENGLKPFECLDSQLSELSASHVEYEIGIDNIDHNGFGDRCKAVGNVACGENTLYVFEGNATVMTTTWMNSQGHRANILNDDYTHVGFGAKKSEKSGKWFATAFFVSENPNKAKCMQDNKPSESPTAAPTDKPTPYPTTTPAPITIDPITTETPTLSPTDEPTNVPTDAPTSAPTDEPTDLPTDAPTDVPTDEPTDSPTAYPTDKPTDSPTTTPPCTKRPHTKRPHTKRPHTKRPRTKHPHTKHPHTKPPCASPLEAGDDN
uniref:Secreted protein n=1 Tax=Achlya hypogyna TaxID=1202772 RepID=A0A0A7CPT3_ACHHY|nr:secreted protein [Achlya hypogyna]